MNDRFLATHTSRSARETAAIGARLGRLLAPGDVVALVGDLGAGKTQLVRGACEGASVPRAEVSSPSFAIVATYHGRIPVHHADLYRIADADELYATGFFDLVGGEGALLVEWADRIPGALPEERLDVRLAHGRGADDRRIEVEGTGPRHAALARAVAAGWRRKAASAGAPPISRPRPLSRPRGGSRRPAPRPPRKKGPRSPSGLPKAGRRR